MAAVVVPHGCLERPKTWMRGSPARLRASSTRFCPRMTAPQFGQQLSDGASCASPLPPDPRRFDDWKPLLDLGLVQIAQRLRRLLRDRRHLLSQVVVTLADVF